MAADEALIAKSFPEDSRTLSGPWRYLVRPKEFHELPTAFFSIILNFVFTTQAEDNAYEAGFMMDDS